MTDTVRFLSDSRHGDWVKGQTGVIEKVLATPPQNQNALYVIRLENDRKVWATDRDVVVDRQMSIFDVLPKAAASSDSP